MRRIAQYCKIDVVEEKPSLIIVCFYDNVTNGGIPKSHFAMAHYKSAYICIISENSKIELLFFMTLFPSSWNLIFLTKLALAM